MRNYVDLKKQFTKKLTFAENVLTLRSSKNVVFSRC